MDLVAGRVVDLVSSVVLILSEGERGARTGSVQLVEERVGGERVRKKDTRPHSRW